MHLERYIVAHQCVYKVEPQMYEYNQWCGPNDGGIKRGDRTETGDEQAQPTERVARDGYGLDNAASSEGTPETGYDNFDTLEDQPPAAGGDLEDLSVLSADDPSLGLTNIGIKPPEDWAADTGPTRSNEEMNFPKEQ
ncbi:MAG: hypothetical protein ACR2NN_04145 [Bryobacteraceae bacterium]